VPDEHSRKLATDRRRKLLKRTAVHVALSVVLLTAALGTVVPVSASENTLRIDPPAQTVAQDGTFTARVVQHADGPTSGVAATITFDPTLVQIESVTRGSAYAEAAVFNGASQIAISAANTTGSLIGVAAAFLAPDAVPAGDAVFLDVTFKAIGCGIVELGLPTGVTDAAMLDGSAETYGNLLSVATVGASVETCVISSPAPSGSPGPSTSSTPSPSVSATPSPSPTPVPGNSIRIEPASTRVDRGATFSVRVVQRADVPTGGITATIVFDRSLLQVVSITKSSAYAAADLRQSASSDAIAAANVSGVLNSVKAEFPGRDSVPVGEADYITVEFRAIGCGRTPLLMPNDATDSSLLDGRDASYGRPLPIRTVKGVVQVCDTQTPPTPTLPSGNSIRLGSFYTGVVENGGFTVRVVQRADVPTGGITATIVFDPAILQVVSITKSSAFAAAPFFQGGGASAITAANASGKLNQVSAAFLAPGNVPAGDADFISVEFKAIACGETPLFLPNDTADSALIDGRPATYGIPLKIQTVKGVVQACDPEAKPTPRPTPTPTPTPVATTPPGPAAPGGPVPPPDPGITLPPTVGEPPVVPASPEPVAEPVPVASPAPEAAFVTSTRSATPGPDASAMNRVALVGLGVGGLIAGLMVVMALAAAMLAGMIAPVVIARLARRR